MGQFKEMQQKVDAGTGLRIYPDLKNIELVKICKLSSNRMKLMIKEKGLTVFYLNVCYSHHLASTVICMRSYLFFKVAFYEMYILRFLFKLLVY